MINQIIDKIENDFFDPFPDNDLKEFILKSSKRIRSKVAILYFKSAGFEINNSILKILAAGEIIHNASLLHDDVIDNAEMRRGKTTISKKYSSKISILAGDYLTSLAIEKLLNLKNFEILNIFKDCIQKMTKAEIKQYFLRGKVPAKSEYIEICEGKTAALFEAIFESCAIILNAPVNNAVNFAKNFGIVFQIKNDLEEHSAANDKSNEIYTAKDILGIENTYILLDNYKEEMRKILIKHPQNSHKQEVEERI